MDKTIDYDRNNPVDGFEDEDLERYLKAEEEFMPAEGYAQSNEVILRATAVRTILNSRLDNADVFEQYLALIYFDRFISKNPLPNVIDCVRDEVVLVANCCLMIAYKMRPDTFDVHRFLVKTKMINNGRHVRIVELVILNSLKWDLELTAISFVNMVIPRITGAENIKRRVVNKIIIQALGDKTVTKYRPSVIAAAAIMTACSLTLREMQPIYYKWIVDTKFVNEVDLEACFVKFCQMCMDKKIIRKKDREAPQSPRVRAASRSPAKDPKLRISDTDAERIVEHKKIIMETDREAPQSPRARAASRSPVKEPKLRISDTDGERKFNQMEKENLNVDMARSQS
ncbi:hypothetical protein Patl1_04523 [Pistacia atlantica]|uniref:Uncharacterized protein n=1 Tax=Pistacia atlantica TaxID=434234 RepID=A0ACC1BSP3_9ROSI|nr:hypothetical protein Patl1_04523 [Pistacia atlantica]